MRFSNHAIWILLAALTVLSGCATGPDRAVTAEEFARYLQESDVKVERLLAEGKREEAVGLLRTATGLLPVSKEPWARLAKLHFDASDYGNAIVAADEVLQRDPADRMAKSVRAVSGLRVAAGSLHDLRNDEKLVGSARADAVQLAKVLRETLGESVLVPPPTQEELDRQAEEARKRSTARPVKARPAANRKAKPAPAAPAARTPGGSNPFSVLR
jgi:tetratricopeptide (TPR) repeat protein